MENFELWVADGFPLEDIIALGREIEESRLFTPGYLPPDIGLTSPVGLIYAEQVENQKTEILPDRNIVSRIAKISRQGTIDSADPTARNSLAIMAYCKGMDLQFEPSIAYHELAHRMGNEIAIEELSWFRGGDNHDTQEWIDLAIGRMSKLSTVSPILRNTPENLASPLHRWRRNYVAVLKCASIALSNLTPVERSLTFLDWMEREFIVAGPAAMFAQLLFSPRSPKKRLLKDIRCDDRGKALEGVKNAAWDITHLSDFIRRVMQPTPSNVRYIFATADKLLGQIAPKLLMGNKENFESEILSEMCNMWGPRDGRTIAGRLVELIELVQRNPEGRGQKIDIDELIDSFERELRSWHR